jgi:chromosome segregation ATPase
LALQSLSDAVASLRERVEKLELAAEEQSDMNGKVHALRVDCDRMDGTVSGLASQLRSLHPQPQSSKGTPASSGAISTDDAARIRQLEATSERHSQAIADSSARMDSLAKEALALRETLTSLQTSVLQLQKDMRGKGAAEEVAANAAALARLQNQLDSIARNASQDRALLESVSQEGNKLRRESKDFQIRTDDSLQMLNRRLDDWRAELAREFVSAATLHEQIAGMGARVDKISHVSSPSRCAACVCDGVHLTPPARRL